MSLAERYKQARILAGYSQGDMAELTHSTPTSVSKIERGLTKNPRHLDLHAKHLGVSESYLCFGIGSEETAPIKDLSPQYIILNKKLQQLERDGLLRGELFQVLNGAISLAEFNATQVTN